MFALAVAGMMVPLDNTFRIKDSLMITTRETRAVSADFIKTANLSFLEIRIMASHGTNIIMEAQTLVLVMYANPTNIPTRMRFPFSSLSKINCSFLINHKK